MLKAGLKVANFVNTILPTGDINVTKLERIISNLERTVNNTSPGSPSRGRAAIFGASSGVSINISNNNFSGNPAQDGAILAENILKGISRNGSSSSAPLFAG